MEGGNRGIAACPGFCFFQLGGKTKEHVLSTETTSEVDTDWKAVRIPVEGDGHGRMADAVCNRCKGSETSVHLNPVERAFGGWLQDPERKGGLG